MMDETPTQVLKEDGRRAETKSYFWVIRTGEDGLNPIILYNYTPTRAGENIKNFLKGIEPGFYFMTDGYQGYNKLKDAKRCCCWAHVRRYLLEAIPKGMEKDTVILQYRVYYTVINFLSMNVLIKKRAFRTNRLKNVASKIRNL